jgi:hypothetical protein
LRVPETHVSLASMRTSWTPLVLVAAVLALPGCGEGATEPDPDGEPLRTLLIHRQDTGENLLWDTDGSAAGEFAPLTRGMIPIASHPGEGTVALLDGAAIVLASLGNPDQLDTIIHPAPTSQSLAAFSGSGRFVAVVAYAPTPGLLLYDRANQRLDTLSLGAANPVLPPMFSPDDGRIALITLTPISILVTLVPLDRPASATTHQLSVSRFTNRLLFGWPRWGEDGLEIGFRRIAEVGPDTLLVGVVDPDVEGALLDERFRALMAPADDPDREIGLSEASTYALTTDGTALALGAVPGNGALHGIYIVTDTMSRIRPLLDAVGETPVYPLFIRE